MTQRKLDWEGEDILAEVERRNARAAAAERVERARAAKAARAAVQCRVEEERVQLVAEGLHLLRLAVQLGKILQGRNELLQELGKAWVDLTGVERMAALRRAGFRAEWRVYYAAGILHAMRVEEVPVGERLEIAITAAERAPAWLGSRR